MSGYFGKLLRSVGGLIDDHSVVDLIKKNSPVEQEYQLKVEKNLLDLRFELSVSLFIIGNKKEAVLIRFHFDGGQFISKNEGNVHALSAVPTKAFLENSVMEFLNANFDEFTSDFIKRDFLMTNHSKQAIESVVEIVDGLTDNYNFVKSNYWESSNRGEFCANFVYGKNESNTERYSVEFDTVLRTKTNTGLKGMPLSINDVLMDMDIMAVEVFGVDEKQSEVS